MHIHILGVCGTFMGSLAQLAVALGHRVTGADANVYPPMSTQLETAGIELIEGFAPDQLDLAPDLIIVGNVISRGNPVMEEVLNRGLPYVSGPQWLSEHVLQTRWVLAVAGTHGKTTTASMLAWILQYAGMSPGYLIGGVPANFPFSASLGKSDFFVIEADEYDTAFFDKRSKFVHYRPRTLLINNLEFDHADIFDDLAAIQRQFHHLLRIVPQTGLVIYPPVDAINALIEQGCWSKQQKIGETGDWHYRLLDNAGNQFEVIFDAQCLGTVRWPLSGLHNVKNALGAIAAARHVGVTPEISSEALSNFKGVKRRMELIADIDNCKVYDDFAHHPTAIATTLEGLRKKVGDEKIIAVIEPRSNTMKRGVHRASLLKSATSASEALWYQDPSISWPLSEYVKYNSCEEASSPPRCDQGFLKKSSVMQSLEDIIEYLNNKAGSENLHIVIMSNGGFEGLHQKLVTRLRQRNYER